jgi:hypothetical protein
MAWIGDAMIAPTRKGADFHVVAYREIGLLHPPGGRPLRGALTLRDRAGVAQWQS